MQMISIFGHPENCSSACKEILNVIHNEPVVQSRGGFVYSDVLTRAVLVFLFSTSSWSGICRKIQLGVGAGFAFLLLYTVFKKNSQ